ncbi:MAG: cation transporter [Bacilli bacterium]|nr:cation transporter [Bacilli bacterium]
MYKIILGIDGMGCGSCEAHVNSEIRKNFQVKKVTSSHIKNQTIIITPLDLSEEDIKKVMDPTGYRVTSFSKCEAKMKFLSWR